MAEDYYVDFDAADDLANGLAPGTPMKYIQTAIDASTKDLSGGILTIHCMATSGGGSTVADNNPVVDLGASGFTNASATNYIRIAPYTGYEPTSTGPQLDVYCNNKWGIVIDVADVTYTRIEGLQIRNTYAPGSAGSTRALQVAQGSIVQNCILESPQFVLDNTGGGDQYIRNCLLLGKSAIADSCLVGSTVNVFYEYCVFADLSTAISAATAGSDIDIKNCAFFNCDLIAKATDGGTWTGANNAHETGDTLPSGPTGWVSGLVSGDFETAPDYRAVASGTLDGAGTVTGVTSTTDMFGTSRDGSTPDIGYYEIAASGTNETILIPTGPIR